MSKLKGFRISDENLQKLQELLKVYKVQSEAQLINLIIEDIYALKKSKALVPYEEFEKRELQLQKALFQLGKMQGILQEKEKQLQKLEEEKQLNTKQAGFFSRLFGKK